MSVIKLFFLPILLMLFISVTVSACGGKASEKVTNPTSLSAADPCSPIKSGCPGWIDGSAEVINTMPHYGMTLNGATAPEGAVTIIYANVTASSAGDVVLGGRWLSCDGEDLTVSSIFEIVPAGKTLPLFVVVNVRPGEACSVELVGPGPDSNVYATFTFPDGMTVIFQ